MIAKWAQEDVETLDNLLNNNKYIFSIGQCMLSGTTSPS